MNGPFALYQRVLDMLNKLPGADYKLAARLAVAYPFWISGRGKVDADQGFLTLSEFAVYPFEEEYTVPLLAPADAAYMAMLGETFLPLLLVFGLLSRFAAAGLLVMVAVITYAYPAGFKLFEFAAWVVPLVAILLSGPGKIAIDHVLGKAIGFKSN